MTSSSTKSVRLIKFKITLCLQTYDKQLSCFNFYTCYSDEDKFESRQPRKVFDRCLKLQHLPDSCERSLLEDLPPSSFVGDDTNPAHPASDVVVNWAYDAPVAYWESFGGVNELPRIWVKV